MKWLKTLEFAALSQSRQTFNAALKAREPDAQKQGWQRDYFQGQGAPNHWTKTYDEEILKCPQT